MDKNKTLKLSGNKIIIPIERMTSDEIIPEEPFVCPDCGGSLAQFVNGQRICYRCKHTKPPGEAPNVDPTAVMEVMISFKINPTEYYGHLQCGLGKHQSRTLLQAFAVETVVAMLEHEADFPEVIKVTVVDGKSTMEKEVKL